jgi:thiol peroxidase
MAETRAGAVTLKGNPLTLVGKALKAGDTAPDFKLQKNDLSDATLADSAGNTRIITTIPSLDTSVCDAQTRRFNQEAAALPGVEILVVSMDLPFAQKRWCGAAGIDKVTTLSAHRCGKFAEDYGVLIQGGPLDRCTARAVFVVDGAGKLKHVEYVAETATPPNFDAALAAAKN